MPKPPRRTMPIRWPLKLVSNWFELPRRMSKLRVRAQLLRRRRDEILGARWTQPRLRPRGSLCCSRPALPTEKGQTPLHGSAPPLKTPSIARHRMKECDEAGAPALAVSQTDQLWFHERLESKKKCQTAQPPAAAQKRLTTARLPARKSPIAWPALGPWCGKSDSICLRVCAKPWATSSV